MPYLALVVLLVALIGVPLLDRATESGTQAPAEAPHVSPDDAYPPRTIELKADRRGHFMVGAHVNGRPVSMLADTGASAVVLTQDDARRTGFNPAGLDYSVPVSTANGTAYVAPVTINRLEVEGILVRDVTAFVAQPGALGHNLLGMTFIGRLTRFSMEGGRLLLVE
jgi:aspartyl protease family protein